MQVLFEQVELALETRKQRQVKNELLKREPTAGQIQEARDYRTRFPKGAHRPTRASLRYNCHGLTFAARRTSVWESEAVQTILDDDGYLRIEWNEAIEGDIVIYLERGDFSHSGIVMTIDRSGVVPVMWILSKWGHAHEVVHKVHECPYAGRPESEISFWRMVQ
jgi:hypothetical protein